MQARQILIERPGGPEVLRLATADVATPGPGEVLLRQTAIGVNFIDIQHRSGRYPLPHYPAPIGFEAVGVVERVGADVADIRAGDRVAYASPPVGAYADLRCLTAERLVRLPATLDDDSAAAVFNKGITAHYLLHTTYVVGPSDTILVHAAAGGVGSLLCQWASHLGATVIGTVGTEAKAAEAAAHGCRFPIVYTREGFPARVREITAGRGVSVVYDSVGRETFEGSLQCLAPRGVLVTFGTASGAVPPLDLFRLNQLGSLYVTSPAYVTHTAGRAQFVERADAVFAAVAAGVLRVGVGQRYALADAAEAHRNLQARRTVGASILYP